MSDSIVTPNLEASAAPRIPTDLVIVLVLSYRHPDYPNNPVVVHVSHTVATSGCPLPIFVLIGRSSSYELVGAAHEVIHVAERVAKSRYHVTIS